MKLLNFNHFITKHTCQVDSILHLLIKTVKPCSWFCHWKSQNLIGAIWKKNNSFFITASNFYIFFLSLHFHSTFLLLFQRRVGTPLTHPQPLINLPRSACRWLATNFSVILRLLTKTYTSMHWHPHSKIKIKIAIQKGTCNLFRSIIQETSSF